MTRPASIRATAKRKRAPTANTAAGRLDAERLLNHVGDDPATLVLLLQLIDRIKWQRSRAGRRARRERLARGAA